MREDHSNVVVKGGQHRPLIDILVAVILGATTLVVGACGGVPATSIAIDGSSTVAPISEAITEDFRTVNPSLRVTVAVSGTGGGFKRFVVGETQISNASRPIMASEAQMAVEHGVEYIELKIAYDGLAVVVNLENDYATCLSIEQLRMIWERDSTINNWNQVDSRFRDLKLELYGPDEESGTYNYFNEAVLDGLAPRTDYTASSDDNVLVRGIAGGTGAVGYFGLAYYTNNADKLNLVAVDSGDGCVKPVATTIGNGTYAPLSRTLFIYVNKRALQIADVVQFVEFYLNNVSATAERVGYVALPAAELAAELAKLKAAH